MIVPVETYPEPCGHCDICNWWEYCNGIRRKDDHLSFIAGMGSSQIKELKAHGVETLEQMSEVALPIPSNRTEVQNRLLQNLENRHGFKMNLVLLINLFMKYLNYQKAQDSITFLNSKGDIYFDLEGDPLIEPSGLGILIWLGLSRKILQNMGEKHRRRKRGIGSIY